ncbi:hypothetical protein ASPVEDRAFT_138065 [Aspergillus versicolor CBS 583.65]|uniref:PHD-type domain-containing protein n=1 Tax=Aspergillus versicolor CBS 583.65 TaxID=1036611 RepID=A0A1L9PV78_ASPVE|nr:uncharacterized protein ASPVEDRAFT_138065 [Aspergillus versicolor CBS 583.65]OJJ05421.1 hypothetical protein ASPVEDRAFT_138065 [Aspergillus versicolor CBS 583.65]
MSQQNGVSSSLASIEAAPPSGTVTPSTASAQSHPSALSNTSSTRTLQASNFSRSGTPSGRVHIPKLSAATTELLARFARDIKGPRRQVLPRDDQASVSYSPFSPNSVCNNQNTNSRNIDTMRASSTLIELPTAPFVYPTRVEAPAVAPNPASAPTPSSNGINGSPTIPNGLTHIAPKPAATPSTSSILTPTPAGPTVPNRVQSSPGHQPQSSNGINGTPGKIHSPINIAPKPVTAYSASTSVLPSPQVLGPTRTLSEHQSPSSTSINGNSARPYGSINIIPRPAATDSISTRTPTGPQAAGHTRPPSEHPSSSASINGTPARPHGWININSGPAVSSSALISASDSPRAPTDIQTSSKRRPPLPPAASSTALAPLAPAPTISNISDRSLTKPPATIPVKDTSHSRQRRSAGSRKSGSKKRKRGHDSDGEDIIRAADSSSDESNITSIVTQTKSGRQVNKPSLYVPSPLSPAIPRESHNFHGSSDRSQEAVKPRKRAPKKGKNTNVICMYCQRGHSPPSNAIVFCDKCSRAWHQHCHDPPIENEVVTVKEKEWLCRECKPVKITILHPTVVRSHPTLNAGPPVNPPLVIPRAEVGGEQFPTNDRRQFLSSLSHAALVEFLLAISDKHPTIPMFPENMESLPSSNFASSQSVTTAGSSQPNSSISANNPVPSTSTQSKPAVGGEKNGQPNTTSERTHKGRYYESSDEDSEYEFQEHRLYPRAGNGVRLSTNQEDLDILQEDPACTTFSYALHRAPPTITGNVRA